MRGDGGNDVLRGDDGGDTLVGGADIDSLFGGDNGDSLFAADGAVDTVNGGPGRDAATVDGGDDLTSVERIR